MAGVGGSPGSEKQTLPLMNTGQNDLHGKSNTLPLMNTDRTDLHGSEKGLPLIHADGRRSGKKKIGFGSQSQNRDAYDGGAEIVSGLLSQTLARLVI
jgi:hypothetical protein